MTLILFYDYSQQKKFGKSIAVTWCNANPGRSQIPKNKRKKKYLLTYIRHYYIRHYSKMNISQKILKSFTFDSPTEIADVKIKKFLQKFVKNGLDNIPAKF